MQYTKLHGANQVEDYGIGKINEGFKKNWCRLECSSVDGKQYADSSSQSVCFVAEFNAFCFSFPPQNFHRASASRARYCFFASVRHIAVLFLNERNAHIVNVFPPSRCDMTLVTRPTRSIARYLLRQRGWVAGWVSVTRRYCIKTAKPILKLFRPSESAIILVSYDSCGDTQFQG